MDSPQYDRTNRDVPNDEDGYPEEQKPKRKVGRPIIFQGNPLSPDVTPEQRRVMLRRIANRESARRVRNRRNEELERLIQKGHYLERTNAILCQKLNKAQAHGTQVQEDLARLNRDILAKERENAELCSNLAHLRKREATLHPLQSSFKDVLSNSSGFDTCSDLPIQPDTPSTLDASLLGFDNPFARDGEWLACLDNIAKQSDFELSPSSFFKD